MTGRRGRAIQQSSGAFKFKKMQFTKIQAQERFMNGKTKIAVISDACSTGISLHSDRAAVNNSKRLHLTIEMLWSPWIETNLEISRKEHYWVFQNVSKATPQNWTVATGVQWYPRQTQNRHTKRTRLCHSFLKQVGLLFYSTPWMLTFSMFRKVFALRPPVSRKMGRVKLSVFTSFSSKTLC